MLKGEGQTTLLSPMCCPLYIFESLAYLLWTGFSYYRKDKPDFCTIYVSETIVVKIIFFTDMLHRRFRSCRHVMSCSLQMVRLTSGGQYKDVHLPDYNTSVEVGSHRLTRPQKPPPTPKWEGLKDLEERTKVKRHVHLKSYVWEWMYRICQGRGGGVSDRGIMVSPPMSSGFKSCILLFKYNDKKDFFNLVKY